MAQDRWANNQDGTAPTRTPRQHWTTPIDFAPEPISEEPELTIGTPDENES